MTTNESREKQRGGGGEGEGEKEKEIEKGGQRDDKRRLRAFAAVLEPRLISPITPYSPAATHNPSHLTPPAPPMPTTPRHRFYFPLALPPIRHPSCSEQRWNV